MNTEEATKNAFIMPFISNVLGYDVFDPSEVVPEFTADVGVKKGEKVDYAIFKNGAVQILIECKKIGDPLDLRYVSQLFRYFAVTSARIAILTNGQEYHVYTDGDLPNRMDEKPFLIFDLLNVDRTLIPEIQKFSKETFDIESVVSAAEELKYIGGRLMPAGLARRRQNTTPAGSHRGRSRINQLGAAWPTGKKEKPGSGSGPSGHEKPPADGWMV